MQIRTQLNDDCPHSTRENVVQKVSETSNARQNESRPLYVSASDEFMYIQVSSFTSRDKNRFEWSLCSIDKFKSSCSFLIKYLLVNWLVLRFGKRFYIRLLECFHHHRYERKQQQKHQTIQREQTRTLLYGVQQIVIENNHRRMEPSHKSFMIDKSFVLFLLHSTKQHHHSKSTTNFYTKLYKVLLNLFHECFNNKANCHHPCWNQYQHQQQEHYKLYLNQNGDNGSSSSSRSVNMFCDLSTNCRAGGGRNMLFLINAMVGFEHHHQRHVDKLPFYVKLCTLSIIYRILLIQRHVMCNNSYEFSDNQSVDVKHYVLLQVLAHNQMILCVTSTWQHKRQHRKHEMKFQMPDDKSCHEIENGISTLATTSNHKLKTTAPNDNDTCRHESEKFSNCYQQFYRTFRSNDSVKSHLNAILFLIILCIPLLTAASSVHNLKYSSNVVKTKYGPLRGIILRTTPTVEGYFGVPYGKIVETVTLSTFDKVFHSISNIPTTAFLMLIEMDEMDEMKSFLSSRLSKSCVSGAFALPYGVLWADKWLTHFFLLCSLLSHFTATPPLGSLRLVINLHHNYSSSR